MKRSKKKKEFPIKKDWQGRWMYGDTILLKLLKKMPPKRQVKILYKAIQTISSRGCSKEYAIALALDCRYEDAGYYSRKTKIKP